MMMRHTSPNQQQQILNQRQFSQGTGAGQQRIAAPQQQTQTQTNPQQLNAANKARGIQPQSNSKLSNAQMQKQLQQQQRQYQPSLKFKPGQAKQVFEHMKLSEPEIISTQYQTAPVESQQYPQQQHQQQLNPVQMNFTQQQQLQPNAQGAGNIQRQQPRSAIQQQKGGFQPQFNSNQSYPGQTKERQLQNEGQQQPNNGNLAGSQQYSYEGGAENQNPYPRQFPQQYSGQGGQGPVLQNQHQVRKQAFTSPDQAQRSSEAMKRSPPHQQQFAGGVQAGRRVNGPDKSSAQSKKPQTHQMKAYDTAPQQNYRDVFYPPGAQQDTGYNMPRNQPRSRGSPGTDDEQIREMENLLAEIGQDVSELKKRPFYSRKAQHSEPRSSQRKKIHQGSKQSSSLSPPTQNRSKSYNSNSQEGTSQTKVHNVSNNAPPIQQPRSLSPQIGITGSGEAATRKQASSQSRKLVQSTHQQQQLLQQSRSSIPNQPTTQSALNESSQWTSPGEHHRVVSSQAPQILHPTPSHTNTMSLTVSVNPTEQNQERLFRLSPLSSKMQEDTDGDEQSTSQRFFNLNQSINNSQLDSSSPDQQASLQAQRNQNSLMGANSSNATIMHELSRGPTDTTNNDRMFTDDDMEDTARIVANLDGDQRRKSDQVRQIDGQQQPYSQQEEPVLMSSNLGSSTNIRTDTPLATSELRNEQSTTRAFSRSSNRRGRNTDVVGLNEGPRLPMKTSECQTDEYLMVDQTKEKEKSVVIETTEQETQTARKDFAPVQLSPFDTYDLFFVKDLVNNLNQDNEVLVDSNQDLKYSFHFLLQKHKQLKQQLTREEAKNSLFESTKKRLQAVTDERDKAIEHGMELSQKVLTMNRIVRLAVDEQAHIEQEAENLTQQLEEENKMLRSILKISDNYTAPTTQALLTSTIQDIEKKQAEMVYQSDLRLREQIKIECEGEFESYKKDLPSKIEKELVVRFEAQTKELESMYEEKLAMQSEQTALLKKTLLEQSLQRLNTIQSSQPQGVGSLEDGSEESNSLEGSHGLHHFSNNSSQRPASQEQLQMSGSFSSAKNNSVDMQQDLTEYANIFNGDLTHEEQALVSELTAKAASNEIQQKGSLPQPPNQEATKQHHQQQIDQNEHLTRQQEQNQKDDIDDLEDDWDSPDLDRGFSRVDDDQDINNDNLSDEDVEDDYTDDFEQFGADAAQSSSLLKDSGTRVQVVTNPKPSPTHTEQQLQQQSKQEQQQQQLTTQQNSEWDYKDEFSENLFSGQSNKKESLSPERRQDQIDDDASPENDLDDYMADSSPPQMASKMDMDEEQKAENIDLLADFGDDLDLEGENEGPESTEREEILRQKYDEFFTSESDEIEDDLIDGESSDSDSESGQVSPNSFDQLVQAQNKAKNQQQKGAAAQQNNNFEDYGSYANDEQDLKDSENDQNIAQSSAGAQSILDSMKSPGNQGTSTKAANMEKTSSSERINKYKRDKRSSEGPPSSGNSATPPTEDAKNNHNEPQLTSFDKQIDSFKDESDAIEFDPPAQTDSAIIAQDFDDFFYSESSGQTGSYNNNTIGKESNNNQQMFDFYDDWDDDDATDLFGPIHPRGASGKKSKTVGAGADGMDEEDRRFFEELSKGFSSKDELANPAAEEDEDMNDRDDEPMDRNELMDDTRATRQMLAAQREEQSKLQDNDQDLGAIDFEADREEDKEDEYDYFLDNQPEENPGTAQGYHIIDEGDLQESDEDLEELDEEEKAQRHREMLKEFKERMEKEDQRASRSPRHKPRM